MVSLDAPESKGTSDLLRRLGRKTTGSRYSLEGEMPPSWRDGGGAPRLPGERLRTLALKVEIGVGDNWLEAH